MKRKLNKKEKDICMERAFFEAATILHKAGGYCGLNDLAVRYPVQIEGKDYAVVIVNNNDEFYSEELKDMVETIALKYKAHKKGNYMLSKAEEKRRIKRALDLAGLHLFIAMAMLNKSDEMEFKAKQCGQTFSVKIVRDNKKKPG